MLRRDDLRAWLLTIDCPDSRAGSQIDGVDVPLTVQRGKVQATIEKLQIHCVLQILAILFTVVIGEAVRTLAEAVVTPAVLVDEIAGRRGERSRSRGCAV